MDVSLLLLDLHTKCVSNFFSAEMDFKTGEEFWSVSSFLFQTFHQRIKHFNSLVKRPFICRLSLESDLKSHLEKRTQTKSSYENTTEGRWYYCKKVTKPLLYFDWYWWVSEEVNGEILAFEFLWSIFIFMSNSIALNIFWCFWKMGALLICSTNINMFQIYR